MRYLKSETMSDALAPDEFASFEPRGQMAVAAMRPACSRTVFLSEAVESQDNPKVWG